MSLQKHANPMCFAIYEKNQLCMACRRDRMNGYECTALNTTQHVEDDCPFFEPMCEYRVNNENGFILCKYKPSREAYECDGHICPNFKEKEIT